MRKNKQDLKLKRYAKKLGWIADNNRYEMALLDNAYFPMSFNKDNKWICECNKFGITQWMYAEINENGWFVNYDYNIDLKLLLTNHN